jgi:hypothetical protein
MTEQSSSQPDAANGQYPLSYTQEFFCSLDEGDDHGGFGKRFHLATALRIAGRVDIPTLQGALDDVVERHESLRTVVIRDAKPAYQQVYPPCQVPLEVRDIPASDQPRGMVAEELILEAERGTISPRQVPVLRATLSRFDDNDSVLMLLTHHSATDAWSVGVIARDLAAFYDARASDRAVDLPPVKQYREFAQWQKSGAGAIPDEVHRYWQVKLDGAHAAVLPGDRPQPAAYTRPFSAYNYFVDTAEMAPAVTFAQQARSSMFMVMMAAFYVFVHELTGRADSAIRALTFGRNEPQFHDTLGPFINFVPFRSDISACASFRDIVASTKDTCIDAYANEVPIIVIEHDVPDFNALHAVPGNSQLIVGMWQQQAGAESAVPIADGAHVIYKRELRSYETSDIPNGMVWNMAVGPAGDLAGNITYNVDEWDEQTVTGWTARYHQILSRLVSEPDRPWREFVGVAV